MWGCVCVTNPAIPFDEEVAVSVWDCRAAVLLDKEPVDYGKLPKRQAAKLERLAEESVERAGGVINWSGIYPLSEKLCQYVACSKDGLMFFRKRK